MTQDEPSQRGGRAALSEETLRAVRGAVEAATGHDFGAYKASTLQRSVLRRMAANGLGSGEEYLALLRAQPREARDLCRDSLVRVTGFFRDAEAFAEIEREVIPRLFAGRDPSQPVRIWHACCASGEEVYSMAMLIREFLDSRGLAAEVRLLATDLDADAVARARSGLYPDEVAAELGEDRLHAFFTRTRGGWQAKDALRKMIEFAPHSLIKDPPFPHLDLLVCRNFLIYLVPEMQKRLVALFHQSLNPGGFLFLGAAETASRCDGLFAPVNRRWRIFRREESPGAPGTPLAGARHHTSGQALELPERPVTLRTGGGRRRVIRQLEERLSVTSEKFLSVREEFHCANEELERSRGELQALNEELVAVNRELQTTVTELEEALSERKRMEEALVRAKQEWERTFDSVPDLIAILDDRQRIVRANRAMSERLGIPAEGCLEPICSHCLHDTLQPPGACPHTLTMQDGLQHSAEIREERLGADLLVTTSPLLDDEGRRIGSVHVAHDITERKRTEEVLRRSEAEFRTLADAIPQLAWMAQADGWIYWYNRRWYEYTGTTPHQMQGWGWQSVHDPDLLPSVLRRWRQCLATGEDFDMTFPLRCADGSYRSFLTRVLPVRDEDGRVIRWFGTNTDVTERIRGERTLHHGNLRLDLMARTAADLLATEAPRRMLESICQKVMEFLECQLFFNYLVDEETGCLRLHALAGVDAEQAAAVEWLDYGVGICGRSARDACRIVVDEIDADPEPDCRLVASWGITAYACHPLIARGRVLGTLSFGTRSRTRFAEEDLSLMKWVADLLSIAMERKRMEESLRTAHDQLEQRVRERTEELASTVVTLQGEIAERERAEESLRRRNRLYAVLSEVDQAIVRARDRDTLFLDFCRIAVAHGGFVLARVGLWDPACGRITTAAASGITPYLDDIRTIYDPEQEGPTSLCIREGSYCICNDFQHDPLTRHWHELGRVHGIRSSASIAIREEERVVGALTLYAAERDVFDRQHVALLQQMADEVSFALDNFRREARRREAELALQQETLQRLRAVEALREQERMLIQQSRQAALGDMIGNIAHQWRQPLNTLGLMIQELSMCYEYGNFSREYLDGTVESAMQVLKHMSQTIDDFRNFFRPEKEKVSFRVRQVIDKAVSIVEASLREHRIELELSACGDPLIEGYPNEYSQVVLNILLNARDACTERGVTDPRIEVRVAEEDGRSVVSIEDNAGGIPEEILEHIFEPYFTTKGPDKGTGVGLYMSKVITEKNMSGRLSVRNRGRGAQFTIEV